jgi:hypothetical protein
VPVKKLTHVFRGLFSAIWVLQNTTLPKVMYTGELTDPMPAHNFNTLMVAALPRVREYLTEQECDELVQIPAMKREGVDTMQEPRVHCARPSAQPCMRSGAPWQDDLPAWEVAGQSQSVQVVQAAQSRLAMSRPWRAALSMAPATICARGSVSGGLMLRSAMAKGVTAGTAPPPLAPLQEQPPAGS